MHNRIQIAGRISPIGCPKAFYRQDEVRFLGSFNLPLYIKFRLRQLT